MPQFRDSTCPLDVQAKLLRTLNSGELRRFRSNQVKNVDVQFVAATNRDLEEMIEQKLFRSDLFERLAEVVIHLPPLRERPEDIEFYLNLYLAEFSKYDSFTLIASGLEAVLVYSWPGNARELWKFVRHAVFTYPNKQIDAAAVENWIKRRGKKGSDSLQVRLPPGRERVIQALKQAGGSRTIAAQILGVDMSTVFRQIDRFGLSDLFPARRGRPNRSI